MMKQKTKLVIAGILSLSILASCNNSSSQSSSLSSSSSETSATTLYFTKSEVSVVEDEKVTLEISTNSAKSPLFSSSDTSIASVSGEGVVLAKEVGDVTITVSIDEVKATCIVHVTKKEDTSSYKIKFAESPIAFSLESSSAFTLVPSLYGKDDTKIEDAKFTFESLDTTIVIVSDGGALSFLKSGTADILVTTDKTSTTFMVDIYDKRIVSPSDWLNIIKENGAPNGKRFYLDSDIDFTGISYEGYPTGWIDVASKCFSSEVNGFGHSLSNIVMGSVPTGACQSLFGMIYGGYIHEIGFQKVTFTNSSAAALADVIGEDIAGVTLKSKVENVLLSVTSSSPFFGLYNVHRGGTTKNVFLELRSDDKLDFSDTSAFCRTNYNWTNGVAKNIIGYSKNGVIGKIADSSQASYVLDDSSIYVTTSLVESAYYASNTFDSEHWTFFPNQTPILK